MIEGDFPARTVLLTHDSSILLRLRVPADTRWSSGERIV
nr:hypothetical protein [Kibdelosporangium sp. MJ126-NF4]CTQ99175.1 hypothetical protein [Kibdelosporangium sp. MJ126-NF4]